MKADIAKADPFLESKPRDINLACGRCGSAVVCYMYSCCIINIDGCAGYLRDAEVMENTAEI